VRKPLRESWRRHPSNPPRTPNPASSRQPHPARERSHRHASCRGRPSLCTDDRRALRLYSAGVRNAVDAQTDCVVQGQAESPVLCPATVARLAGVHTVTLRSMTCLRRMLLVAPAHGPGAVFPRLQSLRLHLVGFLPVCMRSLHVLVIRHARLF
jgi:hypothetical protein